VREASVPHQAFLRHDLVEVQTETRSRRRREKHAIKRDGLGKPGVPYKR
jgi:hypothetical protein